MRREGFEFAVSPPKVVYRCFLPAVACRWPRQLEGASDGQYATAGAPQGPPDVLSKTEGLGIDVEQQTRASRSCFSKRWVLSPWLCIRSCFQGRSSGPAKTIAVPSAVETVRKVTGSRRGRMEGGQRQEPLEEVVCEVEDAFSGAVIEAVSLRKGAVPSRPPGPSLRRHRRPSTPRRLARLWDTSLSHPH